MLHMHSSMESYNYSVNPAYYYDGSDCDGMNMISDKTKHI